jgi:hypothetical protein
MRLYIGSINTIKNTSISFSSLALNKYELKDTLQTNIKYKLNFESLQIDEVFTINNFDKNPVYKIYIGNAIETRQNIFNNILTEFTILAKNENELLFLLKSYSDIKITNSYPLNHIEIKINDDGKKIKTIKKFKSRIIELCEEDVDSHGKIDYDYKYYI